MSLRKFVLPLCMALLCLPLVAGSASAALLASDDFSYPDGSLVPNGGWVSHSGTLGDLQVLSGQAVVQHGVPSEDVNLPFGNVNSGVLTATFDIIVSDDTPISGGDYEYFAHFSDGGTSLFRARLDVVEAGGGGGDYTLGISANSGTADVTMPTDYNFGDTIGVSLSFDFGTGQASVTVGGDTITSTTSSLGDTLSAFALRQSDSSNNETVFVDNLRVNGTLVPEPATFALLSFALIGMSAMRRK